MKILRILCNFLMLIAVTIGISVVQIGLYNDLEYKYESLMKEYEQYKGAMKAMKDLGIYKRDDLDE